MLPLEEILKCSTFTRSLTFSFLSASKMVSKRVIISLLVVCAVAMLAERTEGFLSFLSPFDLQKIIAKNRIRMEKNMAENLQRRSEENGSPEGLGRDETAEEIVCVPLEVGVKMNAKQLLKYENLVGEILSEGTNGQ
uniref:Promotilin n=2 Tax=Callorhinchus milii TaxID=7868 RepID=A0A4W3GHB9_CALMI